MSPHTRHADFISDAGQPFRLDRVVAANVVLLVASVTLLVGYLALCTLSADKGFRLRDGERRVAELTEQQERQAMDLLSLQAMGKVDERVSGLGLVQVTDVEYLNVGGAVAVR
jgi:hypothetical protein